MKKVSRRAKSTCCKVLMACTALAFAVGTQDAVSAPNPQTKYVFFFLGDGMSNTQIQATEAYLTSTNGLKKNPPVVNAERVAVELLKPENRLNMSKMPVQGMQTTYDSFALMTDSASSATAFACGLKTMSGTIGMDETKTTNYRSIAQIAHDNGKKVGVISSVSLDHATPAAYYASVTTRDHMNNIGTQLANTGYEFFGGGGLASPEKQKKDGDTNNNVWSILDTNGYQVKNTRTDILNLKTSPRDKVVCINPELAASKAMPYAIDKDDAPYTDNLTLAEMTDVAIANLSYENPNGFFIMVEGGKIDWAGHANDAMANIGDMIDFDNAVGEALEFYAQHPNETLIIVTGDHETGGMTVGHATTGYTAYYGELAKQKNSYEYFDKNVWAQHKTSTASGVCGNISADGSLAGDTVMIDLMNTHFGLEYATLNDYQKEKLEDAYDKSMCGSNDNSAAENTFLYSGYNPITVTLTHILNEKASIGWTSYSHTGVPVPVFAKGRVAQTFAGFYDNTDIAKRMAKVMGLPALPAQK